MQKTPGSAARIRGTAAVSFDFTARGASNTEVAVEDAYIAGIRAGDINLDLFTKY